MRIFKSRYFDRWVDNAAITSSQLREAVQELSNGLHDGNLGVGVYKKRIAQKGRGKRSSFRTLVAYQERDKAFFMYGYAKNVKANISVKEKQGYRKLAREYLALNEEQLLNLLKQGLLVEV